MKLIVGLGNPGIKYKKTRHNAGFMAVDELVKVLGFEPFKEVGKFKAQITEGQLGAEKVLIAKPQTFMNLSGQSVQALQSYYKLEPTDILVLYDEVEFPLGTLRIRPEGSSGGHNGIASVMQELGTKEVPRVRLGIKPEKPFQGKLEDFVLGDLSTQEMGWLETVFEKLPTIVKKWSEGKIEEAMNEYN